MCVVSMVGDYWGQRFPKEYEWIPSEYQINPIIPGPPSREEFDRLKFEVELMKQLLQKAKEYDEKNNEPNCEIEAKMKFLKLVAKSVGIDLDEILNKK